MSKNTKAKTLRKLRLIPTTAMIFRYGSIILKAGELPFTDVVYDFILKFLYDGYLGVVIKPVCEWLWNWEWYDVVYNVSGKPALVLTILLSIIIRMKEKGGKIVKTKYVNRFEDFGTYRTPKTSLFFKIKNVFRRKMMGNEVNIVKEGMKLVMLRIISGSEEKLQNMTYESEYIISDKLKAMYDKKIDAIILETGNGNRKTVYKGEKIANGSLVLQYL